MILTRFSRATTTPLADGTAAILTVRNACMAYGESVVVPDVSLVVQPGQVVCLMGRNGAGKTTLLKGIVGSLRLRSGSIEFGGRAITRWPSYERARAGIGYVPQGRGIFPFLSVQENLLVGLEPVQGTDDGQIEEMFALFPVLKQMARRTAGVLSGGQQQQLAIARALVGRPRLLVLDEPTEGIQPSIVEEIERVIGALSGKIAILLVEQFLDFALNVAAHCYVLESGVIVLDGAPADLDGRLLREYLAV